MTEETENELDSILVPTICIVAIRSQADFKEINPIMHLPYYQVTIDPRPCKGNTNGFSVSKAFIRFGHAQGDELNGWQPSHEIEIYEVLGEAESDLEIYPQLKDSPKILQELENDLAITRSIDELEKAHVVAKARRSKGIIQDKFDKLYNQEFKNNVGSDDA